MKKQQREKHGMGEKLGRKRNKHTKRKKWRKKQKPEKGFKSL